jgi:hypothetical protein
MTFVITKPNMGMIIKTESAEKADMLAKELGPGAIIENGNGARIIFCGSE